MIINNIGQNWNKKVNFVDEFNVLVGYDMSQQCCEDFFWYIIDNHQGRFAAPVQKDATDFDLKPYRFDVAYFDKKDLNVTSGAKSNAVAFKLIADGLPDLYLVLCNYHNGYYSHGFQVEVGGKTIWSDGL
jgi:hypothetical protein